MKKTTAWILVFSLGTALAAADVLAQSSGSAQATSTRGATVEQVAPVVVENAQDTKNRLRNLLTTQYPSTLFEVLRRDPSLLRNESYLAPYPGLVLFLKQHPEIALNPRYFLGDPQVESGWSTESQRINAASNMFESFVVMVCFMSFFALVGWISKAVVDQRRWVKATKIQQDAHSKVIERLSSNEDLMAYIQTPAAQRYLMSAPPMSASVENPVSAPYSRILSSVQIGCVASLVGAGMLLVSAKWGGDVNWAGDFARMLFLVGSVALAGGLGFVLSGFASYVLSRRFGLIQSSHSNHA